MHVLQPTDVLVRGGGESNIGDYDIVRPVGRGKFSVVYRATRKADGIAVALKKVSAQVVDDKSRTKCLKEVRLLQSLDHPNIIKCLDSFLEDKTLVIVFEWAAAGDLKRQIRKALEREQHFYERAIWGYFCQICKAVRYMHSQRIMHRDLKPANILLTLRGQVKVGDLGLGTYFGEGKGTAHSKVGTPLYMSPEVLRGGGYDWKSDVWSLGCIVYELAMLRNPFKEEGLNLSSLFQKISNGDYPPLLEYYSKELSALACSMMSTDPQNRPDIGQVCSIANDMKQKSDSIDTFSPPPETTPHLKVKDLPPRTERKVSTKKGGGHETAAPSFCDGAATTRRLPTTSLPATECANHPPQREPLPSAALLDDYESDQKAQSSRPSRRLKDGQMHGRVCASRVKNCESDDNRDDVSPSPMGTEGAGTCINTYRQRHPEWSHRHISSPMIGKSKITIGLGNTSRRSRDVRSEMISNVCRGAMINHVTEENGSRPEVDLCDVVPPSTVVANEPMDGLTLGKLIKGPGSATVDPDGKFKTLELMSLRGDSKPLAMTKTNTGTRWESGEAVQIQIRSRTSTEAPSERRRECVDTNFRDAGTSITNDDASQSGETEHEAISSGDGLIAAATTTTAKATGKADSRSPSTSHHRSLADMVVINIVSVGNRDDNGSEEGAGNNPINISRQEHSIEDASGANVFGRPRSGDDECRGMVDSSKNGATLSMTRAKPRPECAYYGTGVVTGGMLVAMEALYDRLTILGYELELRRRGKSPLSRLHFALPCLGGGGKRVSDFHRLNLTMRQPFLDFVALSEWLLNRLSDSRKVGAACGYRPCTTWKPSDASTTVCTAILGSCQALGFEPLPGLTVLPKSLARGHGAAVLELLTWLAQAVVLDAWAAPSCGNVGSSRSLLVHMPENTSTSQQQDIEANDNVSTESSNTHRASFWTGLDGYVKAPQGFPSEASSCFWGRGASQDETIEMECMIYPRVDLTAWEMELERVAPKLKAATRRSANSSWEYRLDVLRKHAATAAITASHRTPSVDDRTESSISGWMWWNRCGVRWPKNKTNGSFSSSKISKEAVNDVGSTTNATDQAAGNSRCRKGHRANSGGAEERDMVALGRGIAIPRDGNKNFNVINDRKDGLSAVSHLRATNSRDDVAWASGSAENLNELSDFHIPTCSECEGVTWNKMIDELRGALSRQMEVVTAGEKMVNAQREFEPLREESLALKREEEMMRVKLQRQKARVMNLSKELGTINRAVDEVNGQVKDTINEQADPTRLCKIKAAVHQLKSDAKAMDVAIRMESTLHY